LRLRQTFANADLKTEILKITFEKWQADKGQNILPVQVSKTYSTLCLNKLVGKLSARFKMRACKHFGGVKRFAAASSGNILFSQTEKRAHDAPLRYPAVLRCSTYHVTTRRTRETRNNHLAERT
jgi:hypothetical protein